MFTQRILLIILSLVYTVSTTHIQGEFSTGEFFKFLVKFGFQKTDIHYQKQTYGYIFGNITSNEQFKYPITFAVLDRYHFLHYYKNRNIPNKESACQVMFQHLNSSAFHPICNGKGQDLFRRIPCPKGELCIDEDMPWNVVKNNQFTYLIMNTGQPRFWYVSMVSCYLDETDCTWHHYTGAPSKGNKTLTNVPQTINYDFWLVNGSPNLSLTNTLLYQFSFDRQNTLELYLVFWLFYIILLPVQIYAVRTQKHPVTKLFTFSLVLEFISFCFNVLHTVKFAADGVGFPNLAVAGDILDIMSRTLFMLLLLLLAKGWAVTRIELTHKPLVFGVWLAFGIVHILLYVWNTTEVDIIEEIDEYQTWPGWLALALRVGIMAWFVLELRLTLRHEHHAPRLHFLLHFGASSLVWLVYLPLSALVALQVSPLWRSKFLLGITNSADCLSFCVMSHLLWPTRSEQYLLLSPPDYTAGIDELDEFSESPHVVHSDTVALTTSENVNADEEEIIFTRAPLKNAAYS
ncbi:transmembrane protein 145 [Amyelois transitella]|uniref:transmembrane protein 145 n=1 Tax=Amyelois transitella TaxID=680683 RepID=UPI00067D113E|nr:transmembrane protein 145 [Amyelois transitella]